MQQVSTSTIALDERLDARWTETLDRLRAYVASRIGDSEAAADITQDVLVRSIASGALEHVENPTAWLYRSAHNAVIDHYRTRRVHESLAASEDRLPVVSEDDARPNEATRDLARCLQPLVHGLSPLYRDALTRVDLDGQTQQQAADQLGISLSGMKSRVQRGRRQLKQLLTRCCVVGLDHTGAVTNYRRNPDACECTG